MSLEQTIRHTVIAESQDLDGRLQQLVRAGLMPANTIPILRKAISKVQGGMTLQGAERDVMANFINSMMFIVLGDDAIFNRARAGAKTYATEEVDLDENRMNRMRDLAMDINSLSHEDFKKKHRKTKQEMQDSLKNEEVEGLDEDLGKHLAHAVKHLGIAQIGDVDHPEKHEKKFHDAVEKVKQSHGEQAAKDFHAHAHDDAHHLTGSGPGERGSQFHKHMSGNEKKSYDKHFNKLLGEGFDSLDELSKATMGSYVKKASGAERPKNVMDPKNVPLTKIAAYQGDSETGHFGKRFNQATYDKAERLRKNRETGIKTAVNKLTKEDVVQVDEISSDMAHRYLKGKHERDYDTSADGKSSKLKKPQSFGKMNKDMINTARALRRIEKAKKTNEEVEQVDEISKKTMGRYINKAKDSIDMTSYRSGIKDGTAISSSTPYKSNNPLERKLTKRHKGISMAVKKLTKEDIDAAKSMNESYKTKFDAALEHYNIKSPSELGEEQRKEFFNHVDLEFKKGDK